MSNFIFIIGASGSGTTLFLKIFSKLKDTIVLGGNYNNLQNYNNKYISLKNRINLTTKTLWDRKINYIEKDRAKKELFSIKNEIEFLNNSFKNIVYKRSTPFHKGDRYIPDIFDIVDVFNNLKIIVLYREPEASTYSSLRRGFVDNISYSAKICEEQLVLLTTKLQLIDKNKYIIINYENFCHNIDSYLKKIAIFCNLDLVELLDVSKKININSENIFRWKDDLKIKDIDFLNKYFTERRKKQFDFLYKNSLIKGE